MVTEMNRHQSSHMRFAANSCMGAGKNAGEVMREGGEHRDNVKPKVTGGKAWQAMKLRHDLDGGGV